MPFTFSHPALVLPLAKVPKRWLSLTGLIAGSVVPDFEYFLRIDVKGIIGHTLSGLFLFCVPLGLLLAILFHTVVRDALISNLPGFLKNRLSVYLHQNWLAYFRKHVAVVTLSVLLGTCSHLLWDSFTHAPGFMVQQLPALSGRFTMGSLQLPVYTLLQHLSTLVGGLVILIVILKVPVVTPSAKKRPRSPLYWSSILVSVVLVVLMGYFLDRNYRNPVVVIVALNSGLMVGLLAGGLLTKSTRRS